ncbi:hypothetical protein CHARACLAT_019844 [Characodon lateralis]|uniref:Uncharacterized protein n=1 Tax=Characodon lateralis TaxID=208331 RepID=A0ABU7EV44_9TELE|nr:hypothetical protein [Characodon lateralis]
MDPSQAPASPTLLPSGSSSFYSVSRMVPGNISWLKEVDFDEDILSLEHLCRILSFLRRFRETESLLTLYVCVCVKGTS